MEEDLYSSLQSLRSMGSEQSIHSEVEYRGESDDSIVIETEDGPLWAGNEDPDWEPAK